MTDPCRHGAAVEGLVAPAVEALREIARVSIPELNPDGDDQAAETMRLIACETLTLLGVPLPGQRQSVAGGLCDCEETR